MEALTGTVSGTGFYGVGVDGVKRRWPGVAFKAVATPPHLGVVIPDSGL